MLCVRVRRTRTTRAPRLFRPIAEPTSERERESRENERETVGKSINPKAKQRA